MLALKSYINILLIGDVKSGKSTIAGHLIYRYGGIDERRVEKLEKNAREKWKGSSKYAWVLDKLRTERGRGIKTDIALMNFETPGYYVTVIDAPGHRNFMKNMITETSQADCALLVVDAGTSELKNGKFKNGPTLEHAQLARTLGVKQLIVGVNKMDSVEPLLRESRFNQIKQQMSTCLTKVGYLKDSVVFVPISGLAGDNIVEESNNMGWYEGWEVKQKVKDEETVVKGKTLVDAIDSILTPTRPAEKPLRLPLQDVSNIGRYGPGALGRVETGIIKPGMEVTFAPQVLTTAVNKLTMKEKSLSEAKPRDVVKFHYKNASGVDIRSGNVCSDANNDPARQVTDFTALVIVMNDAGQIKVGDTPMLDCHTARVACKFSELLKKIDSRSGKFIEDNPKELKPGEAGLIKMTPLEPMSIETFADYPPLGRFVVRLQKETEVVGVIQSVTKK